jgi:spore maturation protein CgeB
MKYDYGRPEQGYSFEHTNFYDSLINMGHDVIYFDFMALLHEHGHSWINRRIVEVVESEKPELLFAFLFTDEFDLETFRSISAKENTTTLNWFADDHWRFEKFSRHWAPCFNWAVTTSALALSKYDTAGITNIIKSQWGCNHFLYRPLDLPPLYDVTFIGQPHGNRRAIIDSLRARGIEVKAWGTGWESGRVDQEDMIRIFNQSRINLNLSNASVTGEGGADNLRRVAGKVLSRIPCGKGLKKLLKKADQNLTTIKAVPAYPDQIKGRNFEVPGCGGFILTGLADDLEQYYTPGEEIATFTDINNLAEKIRFYLREEENRDCVRKAGYERTIARHTYVHRFSDIFRQMGLQGPAAEEILINPPGRGRLNEIR